MSNFSDLDMLYDYDKDCSTAAMGYITLGTKVSNEELSHKYLQLANEAGKVSGQIRKLIEKTGGIS
ncbi:MAG: hypothetical protein AWM53_01213 [Candidatus Dichloromethanomonas elyunquensis]|nr:MAG: hypothetical protein AWM53_01213 [Candidatus Dichloromethanomonas elyunquensis]